MGQELRIISADGEPLQPGSTGYTREQAATILREHAEIFPWATSRNGYDGNRYIILSMSRHAINMSGAISTTSMADRLYG